MRTVAIVVVIGAVVGGLVALMRHAHGAETLDRMVSVCRTEAAVSAEKPMWAWRMIEGKKCWYAGARMRDRKTLFWAPPEPERAVEPVPAPVIVEEEKAEPVVEEERARFTDRWWPDSQER